MMMNVGLVTIVKLKINAVGLNADLMVAAIQPTVLVSVTLATLAFSVIP